jgi:hypothetical protein
VLVPYLLVARSDPEATWLEIPELTILGCTTDRKILANVRCAKSLCSG